MRRAAKIDPIQREIVAALRAAGCSVQSLAAVGAGCPDLLVARNGTLYLLECKTGKAQLNEAQRAWHARFRATAEVVRSAEEALRAVGVA